MSFTFQWPRFSDQFHADAIQMLNNALNKGNKPPVIADKIEVVELEMGTQPPELEIRDIGDLTTDQFRGIFRLTYAGDAHLVLKTKVQANPLNHKQPDIHLMSGSRGMLAAREPLVVPMLLRLSHFKLNSYVVLVVSKQKGITLVFKTDPLQNVDINSTFDSIAVIQKFIQREIEGQLRQMFREDLPGIIHRLSQQWVKAKVEAPYLDKRPPPVVRRPFDTASAPDLSSRVLDGPFGPGLAALQPSFVRAPSAGTLSYGRVRSVSGVSVASSARRTSRSLQPTPSAPAVPFPAEPAGSSPDLDYFDPTYGLRPDGLPTKSVFSSFSRLFKQNKGLADLTEEQSDLDEEEQGDEFGGVDDEEEEGKESYSVLDWEDASVNYSSPASLTPDDSVTEYETIPAVGGGTITRPRVYHAQSMIQLPAGASRSATDPSRATDVHARERTHRLSLPLSSPPSPPPPSLPSRRLSLSSTPAHDPFPSGSPPLHPAPPDTSDPHTTLRPTLTNTLHHLSSLSHSNHTLSPYTRSLAHFAVRSGPPRTQTQTQTRAPLTVSASGVRAVPERKGVKAKRKRTYRIGGRAQAAARPGVDADAEVRARSRSRSRSSSRGSPSSPVLPSEFDPAEIDRYFRSGDAKDAGPSSSLSGHGHGQREAWAPLSESKEGLVPRPRRPRDAYEHLRRRRP